MFMVPNMKQLQYNWFDLNQNINYFLPCNKKQGQDKVPTPDGLMDRCSGCLNLSENGLQIFIRRFDRHNVEIFHQYIEHIGRDKGRQTGTEPDVFDPKMKQGQ